MEPTSHKNLCTMPTCEGPGQPSCTEDQEDFLSSRGLIGVGAPSGSALSTLCCNPSPWHASILSSCQNRTAKGILASPPPPHLALQRASPAQPKPFSPKGDALWEATVRQLGCLCAPGSRQHAAFASSTQQQHVVPLRPNNPSPHFQHGGEEMQATRMSAAHTCSHTGALRSCARSL